MKTIVFSILTGINFMLTLLALIFSISTLEVKHPKVVCTYPVEYETVPDIHIYDDVKIVLNYDEDYIVVTKDDEHIVAPKKYCERIDE